MQPDLNSLYMRQSFYYCICLMAYVIMATSCMSQKKKPVSIHACSSEKSDTSLYESEKQTPEYETLQELMQQLEVKKSILEEKVGYIIFADTVKPDKQIIYYDSIIEANARINFKKWLTDTLAAIGYNRSPNMAYAHTIKLAEDSSELSIYHLYHTQIDPKKDQEYEDDIEAIFSSLKMNGENLGSKPFELSLNVLHDFRLSYILDKYEYRFVVKECIFKYDNYWIQYSFSRGNLTGKDSIKIEK